MEAYFVLYFLSSLKCIFSLTFSYIQVGCFPRTPTEKLLNLWASLNYVGQRSQF